MICKLREILSNVSLKVLKWIYNDNAFFTIKGEARTLEQLDEFGEINEFVSTAKSVIQNLVEKHFPSTEITLPGKAANVTSNAAKNAAKNAQNNNKSFLDILGVGDQIRQQIDKNTRTKESKNSQKVNDILQRLSSYTNNTNNDASIRAANDSTKNSLNKKSKRKNYRSSSMSSSSSIASSADSRTSSKSKISSCDLNDENNDPLESEIGSEEDDDNSEFNSSMFDSFSDEIDEGDHEETEEFLETKPQLDLKSPQKTYVKNYDTDDPFNMCEMFSSDADQFDFHIKSDQNDSGISFNSTNNTIKKEPTNFFDSINFDQLVKSENKNGFESDDSDCLFSITKSVSTQSLMNNTGKKKVRLTSEQRKKRMKEALKRKKNGLNIKNGFHENEDDEDEEINEIEDNKEIKNSVTNSCELVKTDDEFTTSIKRPKLESSDPNDNLFTVIFLNGFYIK